MQPWWKQEVPYREVGNPPASAVGRMSNRILLLTECEQSGEEEEYAETNFKGNMYLLSWRV
jgi:hypothetical protein